MEQRPLGQRSGLTVGRVSIGAMRLPENQDEAVSLLRQAIDAGMRYIDTSRGYGGSEIKVGKALKGGYRERVILSTKSAPWISKYDERDDASADSVRRRIDDSMRRLDVDYLDFYQVWNIDSREHWLAATAPGGMVDGIRAAIAEGLVRHAGFTTHDSVENLLSYLPQADWCEAILVSYNALNQTYAPVLEAAHRLGIATLVMNPVGGGRLAEPSQPLLELGERIGCDSVPDLAVRYCLANPWVDSVVNGITKPSDIADTLASAERPTLDPGQCAQVEQLIDALSARNQGFCTGCGYCKPCPQGINIPAIMAAVHQYRVFQFRKGARESYRWVTHDKGPKDCTHCQKCEQSCTQKLEITRELAWAAEHLAEGTPK